MAYPIAIENAEGKAKLTLAGVVFRGNMLGYSSGWVQADASTMAMFAQWVAMEDGEPGDVIEVCKRCTLYDEDAPYTANTKQFLSTTAGAITEARPNPTGAAGQGDLVQLAGYSIDTRRAYINLQAPREQEMFFPVGTYNALNAGAVEAHIADAGWTGPHADSAAVAGIIQGRFPDNMVALERFTLLCDTMAATALDIDVTITGGFDDASNVQATGAACIAKTSGITTADNMIHTVDVKEAPDAAFALPGRNFAVTVDPDAGDFVPAGLVVRVLVV